MSRPVSRGAAALVNLALAESPEAELAREEKAELADLFRLVDKDGSGRIDVSEFLELLASMSVKPSTHEMHALFAEIDTNNNGALELDEFLAFMTLTVIKQSNPGDLIHAFRMFRGFAKPADIERPSRLHRSDLVDALALYAPDALAEHGKSRLAGASSPSEAVDAALHSLLLSIPFDASGHFDFVSFVHSHTDARRHHEPASVPDRAWRRRAVKANSIDSVCEES